MKSWQRERYASILYNIVSISANILQFSSKVTTAFECREYLKRKEVCVWASIRYNACNLCFRLKRRERGSENRLNWTGGMAIYRTPS